MIGPSDQAESLDALIDGVSRPLQSLRPSQALGWIDHWAQACRDAPSFVPVAVGLDHLGTLLRADRLDGAALSEALRDLAAATRTAAASAPEIQPHLARLSDLLDRGAGAVGG